MSSLTRTFDIPFLFLCSFHTTLLFTVVDLAKPQTENSDRGCPTTTAKGKAMGRTQEEGRARRVLGQDGAAKVKYIKTTALGPRCSPLSGQVHTYQHIAPDTPPSLRARTHKERRVSDFKKKLSPEQGHESQTQTNKD
jgi:hypothetical protein